MVAHIHIPRSNGISSIRIMDHHSSLHLPSNLNLIEKIIIDVNKQYYSTGVSEKFKLDGYIAIGVYPGDFYNGERLAVAIIYVFERRTSVLERKLRAISGRARSSARKSTWLLTKLLSEIKLDQKKLNQKKLDQNMPYLSHSMAFYGEWISKALEETRWSRVQIPPSPLQLFKVEETT